MDLGSYSTLRIARFNLHGKCGSGIRIRSRPGVQNNGCMTATTTFVPSARMDTVWEGGNIHVLRFVAFAKIANRLTTCNGAVGIWALPAKGAPDRIHTHIYIYIYITSWCDRRGKLGSCTQCLASSAWLSFLRKPCVTQPSEDRVFHLLLGQSPNHNREPPDDHRSFARIRV